MDRPSNPSKITFWLVSSAAVAVFFALQGTRYRLEEALACWLLFSLAFGLVTVAILIGVTICSAIANVCRWISGAARAIPHARWTSPTLHPKPNLPSARV